MIENLNDIVTDVQARHKALPNSGSIKVDGLTIGLHGESSNLSHWLKTMAGFASHDTSLPDLSSHAIGVTCCDATICSIATLLTSTTECQTYSRGNESVLRSKIGADVVLDYFPYLGAAWIGSASLQTTEYVYSSRTPFPHLELRLGFVDLINQYMESRGWHSLHSGACRIGEHIVLIVGDSGAGKTTLISRLVLENRLTLPMNASSYAAPIATSMFMDFRRQLAWDLARQPNFLDFHNSLIAQTDWLTSRNASMPIVCGVRLQRSVTTSPTNSNSFRTNLPPHWVRPFQNLAERSTVSSCQSYDRPKTLVADDLVNGKRTMSFLATTLIQNAICSTRGFSPPHLSHECRKPTIC